MSTRAAGRNVTTSRSVVIACLLATLLGCASPMRAQKSATTGAPGSCVEAARCVIVVGRIVDAEARPVAGARVACVPPWPLAVQCGLAILTPHGGGDFARVPDALALPHSLTGDDGSFRVSVAGWTSRRPRSQGAGGFALVRAESLALAVIPLPRAHDGVIDLGDVPVAPERSVRGRLLDERGLAVAGVRVGLDAGAFVRDPSGASRLLCDALVTHSDAEGRFELDGLWSGSGLPLALCFDEAVVPSTHALDDGQDDVGDVVVTRGHGLAGVVRDARGTPVAGATVLLDVDPRPVPSDPEPDVRDPQGALFQRMLGDSDVRRTRSDTRGAFAFAGLASGVARLGVFADDCVPLVVDVVPGEPPSLVLERAGGLQLACVDAVSGEPIDDVKLAAVQVVSARHLGGFEPRALIARGAQPGTFVVSGAGVGGTYAVCEADGYARQPVELPGVAPGELREVRVPLVRGTLVRGHVREADGTPAAASRVGAWTFLEPWRGTYLLDAFLPPDLQPYVEVPAADDGSFELRLLPGRWSSSAALGARLVSGEAMVDVGAEPLHDMDLVLPAPGRVSGHLHADDLDLARRVLLMDGGSREVCDAVFSDATGAFAFEDLPAGTYSVWVASGESELHECVVVAGETCEVDLVLASHAR